MDLREALLAEHSKDQAQRICNWVGDDSKRFAELIKLMTGPVYRVSQRAAWPVNLCAEQHPALLIPHFNLLIKQLERNDSHPAVRRNVARMFQFVEIPNRFKGRVFNACYNLLNDSGQPVAVRVFSMTAAARIANDNKELIRELKLAAEQFPSLMTPALRSRMQRIFEK